MKDKKIKTDPPRADRQTYLDAIPPAIAYSRGHNQTFKVACLLYNGWSLTEDETLAWLKIYNPSANRLGPTRNSPIKPKKRRGLNTTNHAAISLMRQSSNSGPNRIGPSQANQSLAGKSRLR